MAGWGRGGAPIEHGHAERRFRERVRNCAAELAVGGLEFLASAFAHRVGERPLEVAKERKRLARSPLLAHEQERRHRRKQRDRKRCGQRSLAHVRREAVT